MGAEEGDESLGKLAIRAAFCSVIQAVGFTLGENYLSRGINAQCTLLSFI